MVVAQIYCRHSVLLVGCFTWMLTAASGEENLVAFLGSRKHGETCPMIDADKINCGFVGILQEQCQASGCCYAKSQVVGTPWCFFPKKALALAPGASSKCTLPDDDRLDCGHTGITSDQCHRKGCCYFQTSTPGVPFCFFPRLGAPTEIAKRAEQCSILDTQRVECGWQDISRTQCQQKGCCYRHALTPGVPYCYYTLKDAPAERVAEVEQCTVSDSNKMDCGFPGITPDGCRSIGCCYMHSINPGTPFCFYKKGSKSGSAAPVQNLLPDSSLQDLCTASSFDRVNCGFAGVTEATCRAKGCCYENSSVRGAPVCFYRSAPKPTTTQSVAQSTSKVRASTASAPATSKVAVIASASSTVGPATQAASVSGDQTPVWDTNRANVQAVLGSSQSGPSNAKKMVAALTGVVALLLLIMAYVGYCRVTHKAPPIIPEEQRLLYSRVLQETECTRLVPDSDAYQEFHRLFMQKWDTTRWPSVAGRNVPPPQILDIFSVSTEGKADSYKEKQRAIDLEPGLKEGKRPGNEKRRFHGARMTCDFQGAPCRDPRCAVCRIVEQGGFSNDQISSGAIRFSAGTHTAKGQGLAPGKEPPPANLDHFVGAAAGNAVFVADVLLGRSQIVSSHTSAALPAGTHSRIADKACGVDEILIYDDAQALPRALILFA